MSRTDSVQGTSRAVGTVKGCADGLWGGRREIGGATGCEEVCADAPMGSVEQQGSRSGWEGEAG